jgi:hypothetical protein
MAEQGIRRPDQASLARAPQRQDRMQLARFRVCAGTVHRRSYIHAQTSRQRALIQAGRRFQIGYLDSGQDSMYNTPLAKQRQAQGV